MTKDEVIGELRELAGRGGVDEFLLTLAHAVIGALDEQYTYGYHGPFELYAKHDLEDLAELCRELAQGIDIAAAARA